MSSTVTNYIVDPIGYVVKHFVCPRKYPPPQIVKGGSVVRALARDRKVASSTPGLSATE